MPNYDDDYDVVVNGCVVNDYPLTYDEAEEVADYYYDGYNDVYIVTAGYEW